MHPCCSKIFKMNTLTVKAPAKVNLTLKIVGRRPNGYHDLEMVMVPLSLADEISLTKIPHGIEFSMEGFEDAGMASEKNLVFRAAGLLAEEAHINDGVKILLKKRVPLAAGLGGGSSDAAATLKGLNLLWNLGWSSERLASLGARIGADVPFFCFEGPAFVRGIGDRVLPYKNFPKLSMILVNPSFVVSTPWAYKQWDLQLTKEESNVRVRPIFKGFSDVIESLHNDLEAVTIPAHPEIAKIKTRLVELGASGALMSGSGPTVFGVFKDASVRDRALAGLTKESWRIFAVENIV